MQSKQYLALCLVVLITGQTFALPSTEVARKFAEKPNTLKKVASSSLDDVEDISSNSIQVNMFTKGRQNQVKYIFDEEHYLFFSFPFDVYFVAFDSSSIIGIISE